MQEQRQLHRPKTYLGAEIGFNSQIAPIECIVRNLSACGAMLQLDAVSAIPRSFELNISAKSNSYKAQLVWQQPGRAGLVFENDDTRKRCSRRAPSVTDRERLEQRITAILEG